MLLMESMTVLLIVPPSNLLKYRFLRLGQTCFFILVRGNKFTVRSRPVFLVISDISGALNKIDPGDQISSDPGLGKLQYVVGVKLVLELVWDWKTYDILLSYRSIDPKLIKSVCHVLQQTG